MRAPISIHQSIPRRQIAIFRFLHRSISTQRDARFFAIGQVVANRSWLGGGQRTGQVGRNNQLIPGTPDEPSAFNYGMDAIAQILNDAGVLPYWSYCYTPMTPARSTRRLAIRAEGWPQYSRIPRSGCPAHRKLRGTPIRRVSRAVQQARQCWHFTVGDMNDYFECIGMALSRFGRMIRAGLGGPRTVFTYSWIDPFV